MANYRTVFKKSVAKDLRKIPNKDINRILQRVDRLADDPRPIGVERLSGDEKFRIKQGKYRILYAIDDDVITVTIVKVGHRRDIYR